MKAKSDNQPIKSQTIAEAEERRADQARKTRLRSRLLATIYELSALLRKYPDTRSHVQHLAMEQQQLALSLNEDLLAGLFFDISKHDHYVQIHGSDRTLFYLDERIKSVASKLNLPPQATADQKRLLNENSLPILAKMVQNPEASLEYFYELAEKLDELVQAGELDWQAAASEVYYTLDRPQIYTHEPLEPAIIAAYDLSAQHDKTAWNDFVVLVRRSKQNIKEVDKK